MDYKTKGTSRKKLRIYAKYFRALFDVPQTGAFPVMEILDKIPDVFEHCNYEVVEDNEMQPKTMAECSSNDIGGFTIRIKESVYNAAYNKNDGACRGFILHEVCNIFLFKIGFTPIYECSFSDGEIPAYCSVEWQAKALCGEVMIPFEESKGMTQKQIVESYIVSKAFAKKAYKDRKEVMQV